MFAPKVLGVFIIPADNRVEHTLFHTFTANEEQLLVLLKHHY